MKKIKIILPNQNLFHWSLEVMASPLVLAYLAALTPKNFEVQLLDLARQKLDLNAPVDLVALSVITRAAPRAYAIAQEYRRRGVPVVMGGHHVSALPQEARPYADAIVIGEAEETWPLLLADFLHDDLKDFYVAGPLPSQPLNGRVLNIAQRPDMRQAPAAARHLIKPRYFFDTIFTTRGCPFNCKFCSVSQFFGPQIRHRPISAVLAEIEQLGMFYFLADDNIFDDVPYRLELYQALSRTRGFHQWFGQASIFPFGHPEGEKMVALAARAGLTTIFAGIEALHPAGISQLGVQGKLQYHQPLDLQQTAEAIKFYRSLGIGVMAFFILGLEHDTPASFTQVLEFARRHGIMPIPLLLSPFPGTALFEEYRPRLIPHLPWDYWDLAHAVYTHRGMSPQQREKALIKLRRQCFGWGEILRRWPRMGRGSRLIFPLITQVFMKWAFAAEALKVLADRQRVPPCKRNHC